MKATAEKMGLEITGEATFSNGDVDFSAQLTKLKQTNPDALLVSALYKEGSMVVKKLVNWVSQQRSWAVTASTTRKYLKSQVLQLTV